MTDPITAWALSLPAYVVLNRFRGGGWPRLSDPLPGRALYYVAALYGLLAGAFLSPVLGLFVGLGFLVWGAPGWGLWFDLHLDDGLQRDDPRRDDAFVRVIDAISCGSDYAAMFWRLGLFVLPMLLAFAVYSDNKAVLLLAVPFALAGVGAYEVRKRLRVNGTSQGNPAEYIIGGLWWLLVSACYLLQP